MKKVLFFTWVLILTFQVGAQSSFQNILTDISDNNPDVRARQQAQDARISAYRTGITPYDPTLSFDYLIGFPRAGGNQADFLAVQSFDFPSVYAKKRALAAMAESGSTYAVAARRQEVLLEARRTLVELTYANKMNAEWVRRIAQAEQVYRMLERKMNEGEGNILDANKAKLQWLALQNERQLLESRRSQYREQLAMLSGGRAIAYADTLYPMLPSLPEFDSLETRLESIDPMLKAIQAEERMAMQEVSIAKALLLPRLEAGYHYQGILGQRFHGLHVGMSVPLWEKKNTVQQRQLETLAVQSEIAAHRNEHYYRIKQAYERYTGLRQTLSDYQALLASTNNLPLLEKALRAGQISATEYYLDALQFYALADKALLLEKEMYLAAVELWQMGW
ncbi:MAG TPA: TolC family protein [Saprospiraceae bacterium]|nr:TolC family protein [Saprospiraceae bacterium]HOY07179.1 TolC family protein [Saprospiraceae bacterium]HPI08869.1 TolC family protein [Saprospiraceae bacterium]